MITVRKLRRVEGGRELVDLALSSNDTKPTNVINGSKCIEVNTGDSYVYDEENTEWNKISTGGGGGSSDFSIANVTVSMPNNFTQNGAVALSNIVEDNEVYGSATFGDIAMSGNYKAVLYKGKCFCYIYAFSAAGVIVEISGDITEFEEVYLITGDCTITISYDI